MANATKRIILQTFEEMLEEMPFSKVTVSALVTRCEISSNTFYYHFKDIFDLLDAWMEKKTEYYRKQTRDFEEWDDGMKFVLHDFQKNEQLVYHVFDSLSRERMERYIFTTVEELFYEYMKRRTADAHVSGEALEWISQAYCYAILGFVLKFLWEKMDIDIDTSVDKLYQLFNGALEDAVKRVEANEA